MPFAQTGEEISANGFIYRAITTNQESLSNHEIVHWYNQSCISTA